MQLPFQIRELLANPEVTDVVINSQTSAFAVVNNQFYSVPHPFPDSKHLIEFAKDCVELGGDHLDFSNPVCDVSLSESQVDPLAELGISSLRIHAVLAQGISSENLLSIRVHRTSTKELQSFGKQSQLFSIAQAGSFVISGRAGSGKTTLLRAMLGLRPDLRTIVIEDTPELLPISGHVVGMHARRANSEGAGEISLQRLLTESLRMRPERLVIGEVRGAEVTTALQALNLGVEQVAFTIHANSAEEVYSRLLALWLAAGFLAVDFDQLLRHQAIHVVQLEGQRVKQIARLG